MLTVTKQDKADIRFRKLPTWLVFFRLAFCRLVVFSGRQDDNYFALKRRQNDKSTKRKDDMRNLLISDLICRLVVPSSFRGEETTKRQAKRWQIRSLISGLRLSSFCFVDISPKVLLKYRGSLLQFPYAHVFTILLITLRNCVKHAYIDRSSYSNTVLCRRLWPTIFLRILIGCSAMKTKFPLVTRKRELCRMHCDLVTVWRRRYC
jgi:hypothetical protein